MQIAPLVVVSLFLVGLARAECTPKPTAELQSMATDDLVIEVCEAASRGELDKRSSDSARAKGLHDLATQNRQAALDCSRYSETIARVLRTDRSVDTAAVVARAIVAGSGACIDDAKVTGIYGRRGPKTTSTERTTR